MSTPRAYRTSNRRMVELKMMQMFFHAKEYGGEQMLEELIEKIMTAYKFDEEYTQKLIDGVRRLVETELKEMSKIIIVDGVEGFHPPAQRAEK